MERTTIKKIFTESEAFGGKEVTVGGWVRNLRDSKAFGFIDLNDGSYFKSVQVVFERDIVSTIVNNCRFTVIRYENPCDSVKILVHMDMSMNP